MFESSPLSINTLFIFDVQLINEALFLSIQFLLYPSMVLLFSVYRLFFVRTVIVPFTTICVSL